MIILKNMLRKFVMPIMTLTLVGTSCNLDIKETDSLITKGPSSIFNGLPNASASLDAIYNNITGEAGDQGNLYALTEVTTDELLVPTRGTDWGDNGVWRTLHAHTWSSTHSFILNVWNQKNSGVLRASEIIDTLTVATDEIKAQARFTRAYNMWIILDFFGQVPFRNPSDGPEVIPIVFPKSVAYDTIVNDLTKAIPDLPVSNPTSSTKTRAVQATAKFLLAKVILNKKAYTGVDPINSDYQKIIDLVDEIEADGYSLVSEYFNIFPGTNVTNTDVIWSVNASAGNRMWNGLHYNQAHVDNGGGGWNGFTTLAEFYDKFEGPSNDNSLGSGQEERRGYTHTLTSTNATNQGFGFGFQLGQMYGWKDGEAVALKARNGNPLVFTKELPGLVGNNEVTGIRLLKYSPANGAFTNGVVMARFADAHLMRAEAMFRMGNTSGALAEVNELRALRTNTTPLASLDETKLLDERARELYTEGWRRNDLIRFGKFKDSWQFKDGGDGHTDLFPIPASALLSNPNLTQNPGY